MAWARNATQQFPGFEMSLLAQSLVLCAMLRGLSKDDIISLVSEEHETLAVLFNVPNSTKN